MYSDYEYKCDEADEGGSSRPILLTESGRSVVLEKNDEYPPSVSADHCYTLNEVAMAYRPSPVPFMTAQSDYTNKTIIDVENVDWFRDTAGRDDTRAAVVSERTGQLHVAVTGAEHDMSEEKTEEKNAIRASSRSDFDDTESHTNHGMVCEGHRHVDWSELASALAALQSSDDESVRSDKDSQEWASDDEEPELCNLLVNSSTETIGSKISDDYEKDTREGEVCDCDDQLEETRGRNNIIVDENGTFEEVCLSSSTYYFACSDQDDARGSFVSSVSCFSFFSVFCYRRFFGFKNFARA